MRQLFSHFSGETGFFYCILSDTKKGDTSQLMGGDSREQPTATADSAVILSSPTNGDRTINSAVIACLLRLVTLQVT